MKRTKVTDYKPDKGNSNRHTERGMEALDTSVEEVGLGRSIVVDRNGIVLAGNATHKTALERGVEDAIEVVTNGDALVVVRREDLDLLNDTPDHKARKYTIYDNRVGQINLSFNADQIAADIQNGVDLSAMWTPDELSALVGADLATNVVDDTSSGAGDGAPVDIPQQYMVIVECTSEQHQAQVLERLTAEGLRCRALMS